MKKNSLKPRKQEVSSNELTSSEQSSNAGDAEVTVLSTPELLTHILSYITNPDELTKLRMVSQFWQGAVDNHPNWRTILQKALNRPVKKIPSDQARKKYVAIRTSQTDKKLGKFFGTTIPFLSKNFQKNDDQVFMAALDEGNLDLITHLVNSQNIDMNMIFKDPYDVRLGIISYLNCRPIHIAILTKNSDLIKFLLSRGVDIEVSVTKDVHSRDGHLDELTTAALADKTNSHKVMSIVRLAMAEKMLRKKDLNPEVRIAMTKEYIFNSNKNDSENTLNYINNVKENRQGYTITYSDDELNSLNGLFEKILSQEKNQSSCLIS